MEARLNTETRPQHLFPQQLLTDSDWHVSKLSNAEYRRQRDNFKCLIKHSCWDKEMKKQYVMVLNRRSQRSLDLPEPFDLNQIVIINLLAVFSKMHPITFVLASRVSKTTNKIMSINFTKFRIRIKDSTLFYSKPKGLCFSRGNRTALNQDCIAISDSSSILPFTFSRWAKGFTATDMPTSVVLNSDLFDRMRYPFLEVDIRLTASEKLDTKPWMRNVRYLKFEKDSFDFNWNLKQDLERLHVPHSVDSETQYIIFGSRSYADGSLTLPDFLKFAKAVGKWTTGKEVVKIVKMWKEGNWAEGYSNSITLVSDMDENQLNIIKHGSFCYSAMRRRLIFVPNPDGVYLLFTRHSGSGRKVSRIHTNIHSLSDLIWTQEEYLSSTPIDYSSYSGDPDADLDPLAYIRLLKRYKTNTRFPFQ